MFFSQQLKSFIFRLAFFLKYQHCLLHRIAKNNFLPVLSLHRVSPTLNPFWSPLSPQILDELLTYLKKHFHLVTFHELREANSKKPSMIITFDDGYYDFIEYAMPILHKHNIRVNQNIIPSQLLGEAPLWNIALYDFLNAAPLSLIEEIRFSGFEAKQVLQEVKMNKVRFGVKISQILKRHLPAQREAIMRKLTQRWFTKLDSYPTTRMIRLNEMPEVLARHEVGVHSFSHQNMGQMSMEYFVEDFRKCRDFFAQHHLPSMDIYAFPNGSYNQSQVDYLLKNQVPYVLLSGDRYALADKPPYHRFNIAAFDACEAIFQSIGIKDKKR